MKLPTKKPNCSVKVGLVTPVPMLACRRVPVDGKRCDIVSRQVVTSAKPLLSSCRSAEVRVMFHGRSSAYSPASPVRVRSAPFAQKAAAAGSPNGPDSEAELIVRNSFW